MSYAAATLNHLIAVLINNYNIVYHILRRNPCSFFLLLTNPLQLGPLGVNPCSLDNEWFTYL